MIYTLTSEEIEEMVLYIVDCGFNQDEAIEYARKFCNETLKAEDANFDMIGDVKLIGVKREKY